MPGGGNFERRRFEKKTAASFIGFIYYCRDRSLAKQLRSKALSQPLSHTHANANCYRSRCLGLGQTLFFGLQEVYCYLLRIFFNSDAAYILRSMCIFFLYFAFFGYGKSGGDLASIFSLPLSSSSLPLIVFGWFSVTRCIDTVFFFSRCF